MLGTKYSEGRDDDTQVSPKLRIVLQSYLRNLYAFVVLQEGGGVEVAGVIWYADDL